MRGIVRAVPFVTHVHCDVPFPNNIAEDMIYSILYLSKNLH